MATSKRAAKPAAKTGKKPAGAKKKGAWAAVKRHPFRALGAVAAAGVGAVILGKKVKGRAGAKSNAKGAGSPAK